MENKVVDKLKEIENETKQAADSVNEQELWRLTIDFIMIVGKYLETNQDFINIMKVCKKYKELVLMYLIQFLILNYLKIFKLNIFIIKKILKIRKMNYSDMFIGLMIMN